MQNFVANANENDAGRYLRPKKSARAKGQRQLSSVIGVTILRS